MAQQINLYNPIFLKQKKYFSAVTMLQALGLLLGGVVAFHAYTQFETKSLQRIAGESGKQLAAQSEQLAKLTRDFSPAGRSKLLEDETVRMTARLRQREELLGALRTGGLGNTDGFARYLAAFARQTLNGVWLTSLTIGGDESELLLSGRVLHPDLVPAYIRALNREEVMRGRRVSEMRLTAREERPAATTAPGANPAAAGAPAAAPLRYVEFSVTASRGTEVVAAAGSTAAASPAPAAALIPGIPAIPEVPGLGAKGAK